MTRPRGFTLLEMLIATVIMGIAVVGLLASISTSLRNAARLTDYDRAAVLARQRMDELLIEPSLPEFTVLEGRFDTAVTGGEEAGWRARLTPFEMPPNAASGAAVLNRLELEVWWKSGAGERKLTLEGFRPGVLPSTGASTQ